MKPLLSIAEAVAQLGTSRSQIYVLIGEKRLRAVKLRSRTMIDGESLRTFVESLPEAQIAPPRPRSTGGDA